MKSIRTVDVRDRKKMDLKVVRSDAGEELCDY